MASVTASLQIRNGIYQAVLSYKDNGKWITKWKSTKIKAIRGNKKKAENQKEKIKENFVEYLNNKKDNNKSLEELEEENMLFIDYMKKWLKMIKSSVEITTYNGYKGVIDGRMSDYFQHQNITLGNIKPRHIQAFYQYLLELGLSGNTVKHYHANIRKALQYAMKTDVILSNPADKVELPKIKSYMPVFYTSGEVKKLLNSVQGLKLEIPVTIGCFYGLRRSEVIGLKWSAIDFENKTIVINHTITQSNGKLVIRDRTKTKSSRRILPLEPIVESYLKDLREKQENNMKICGKSYNYKFQDYICVDDVGNLIYPDYVTSTFRKKLKQNNLKLIRFHDLRHSCASILLRSGANMKEIQAWLGHSNYNTTANLYAHLDLGAMNRTGKLLSNVFGTEKEVA